MHSIVSEATSRPYDEHHLRHTFATIRAHAATEWPQLGPMRTWPRTLPSTTAATWYPHLCHTALTKVATTGCTVPEIAAISEHMLRLVKKILEFYLARTPEPADMATRKRLIVKCRENRERTTSLTVRLHSQTYSPFRSIGHFLNMVFSRRCMVGAQGLEPWTR